MLEAIKHPTHSIVPLAPANVVPLFPTHRRRVLCVLLAIAAVLSFRSVPRVLKQMQPHLALPLPIPHFTSVINWSLRVGLAKTRSIAPSSVPWVALIDMSIDAGIQKLFVVLSVSLDVLARKGSAVGLEDCECVGCHVRDSWNGEDVARVLGKVFQDDGLPRAVLRDGGSDLKKGVNLWRTKTGNRNVAVVSDVGHVVACAVMSQLMLIQSGTFFPRSFGPCFAF
jgi:hypothetical protein